MSSKSGTLTGVEESAVKILKRAIELEGAANYQPALVCYQEGIDLLLDVLKGCKDASKRKHFREKVEEYMTRAEQVKDAVQKLKESGKYHEQMKIEENSTGFGYSKVFGPYVDEYITEVHVEDAYIRSFHQINNFVRFCEMLIMRCKNVTNIHLTTTEDSNANQQKDGLHSIAQSLLPYGITLRVEYSTTLHDREITFSNGWIIKIGRGLDYFKKADKFSIGFHEMDLRKCHATTIDVFHKKHTRDR
ncbi:MIT domain-containing protein 1-like [Clavelina lepadiformis]|uniref:MIT domain-containing protein n=1 Tax=Clavelina lepadiformis TaxID=159417 RepID=A0ABP0FWC7_CLALP